MFLKPVGRVTTYMKNNTEFIFSNTPLNCQVYVQWFTCVNTTYKRYGCNNLQINKPMHVGSMVLVKKS